MQEACPAAEQQGGFSLIEAAIAMILIIVPTSVMVVSVASGGREQLTVNERFLAIEAAKSKAEEIRATPIGEITAKWGPGGTEGPTFSVPELDGDALAGSVQVIVDETLTDDQIGFSLGMPRDLDGDLVVASVDVSTTAVALPVIVTVTWGPPNQRETFQIPVIVLQ